MEGVAKEVAKAAPVVEATAQVDGLLYSETMQQIDEAQADGDFVTAKALLSRLRKKTKEAAAKAAADARDMGRADVLERPEDPYIVQRLALVTYKSKHPSAQVALEEARELLLTLKPRTSNDTETLGLWGAVHKRLWDLTQDRSHLDEATRGYERGFYLRNDYYNGINVAYLLNVRAAHAARPAEAIADFVQAERVRREVIDICLQWLESETPPVNEGLKKELREQKYLSEAKYWVMASLAEAYVGVGDEAEAQRWLSQAIEGVPAQWMKDSTQEQLRNLRNLITDSPLKFVRAKDR
jgi:tetratricopeptide (TPR) repeat protein